MTPKSFIPVPTLFTIIQVVSELYALYEEHGEDIRELVNDLRETLSKFKK